MPDFPAIVPTVRSGGTGEYAVKTFPQIAGNVTKRIYAKYANKIPLILEFGAEGGIPDADVADIYQAWLDCSADRIAITLDDALFAGMDTALRARIPSGMQFFFSQEEPSIVDTVPGRKLVRLRLEGRFAARSAGGALMGAGIGLVPTAYACPAERESGDPPAAFGATAFKNFTVSLRGQIDRAISDSSLLSMTRTPQSFRFDTQDDISIFASWVPGIDVETVVGAAPSADQSIRFLGDIEWFGGPSGTGFAIDVNMGFGKPSSAYRHVISSDPLELVRGLWCNSFLGCTNPPFTNQIYGQAAVGYEQAVTVNEFAFSGVNQGLPYPRLGESWTLPPDLVPPLPHRPYFGSYVDQDGNNAGGLGAVNFSAIRIRTIVLVPELYLKVSLFRVSTNRFRLQLESLARGGVMVLRYSVEPRQGVSMGPTIVTMPHDATVAFFDVTPFPDVTSYTVTLERCFGLPRDNSEQFWPIEPHPTENVASGP